MTAEQINELWRVVDSLRPADKTSLGSTSMRYGDPAFIKQLQQEQRLHKVASRDVQTSPFTHRVDHLYWADYADGTRHLIECRVTFHDSGPAHWYDLGVNPVARPPVPPTTLEAIENLVAQIIVRGEVTEADYETFPQAFEALDMGLRMQLLDYVQALRTTAREAMDNPPGPATKLADVRALIASRLLTDDTAAQVRGDLQITRAIEGLTPADRQAVLAVLERIGMLLFEFA
jgi:hypothetical protein